MNKEEFWKKHSDYMKLGMEFAEAFSQTQLDEICEMHDSMIDELYPLTRHPDDSESNLNIQ